MVFSVVTVIERLVAAKSQPLYCIDLFFCLYLSISKLFHKFETD